MMKILIAYDGSESASIAIEDFSFAGLPAGGEAVVLYAVEDGAMPYRSSEDPQIIDTIATHILQEGVLLASRVLPGYSVTSEYRVEDDPSEAILTKAEEWRPDLIVLGARSQSSVERVLFGSITQQVLTHTRTSVRIGRFAETFDTSPCVLVAIDGSLSAIQALKHIADRQWRTGTKFRLVTVLTFSRLMASSTLSMTIQELLESQMQQRSAWILARHQIDLDRLHSQGFEVTCATIVGNPKHKILEEAASWGADSIVMGSLLLSTMERLLIGSVSLSVASRAHCSVEVIR